MHQCEGERLLHDVSLTVFLKSLLQLDCRMRGQDTSLYQPHLQFSSVWVNRHFRRCIFLPKKFPRYPFSITEPERLILCGGFPSSRLQLDFKASGRFEAAAPRLFARYPGIENFLTLCVNLPRLGSTWERSLDSLSREFHTQTHTEAGKTTTSNCSQAIFKLYKDMGHVPNMSGISAENLIYFTDTAKYIGWFFLINIDEVNVATQQTHTRFYEFLSHWQVSCLIFYCISVPVFFPFAATAVYFLPSWSAILPLKSRHRCVCAHECNARPHGKDPRSEWVARRWHTTGALCPLPDGLPSKTRRRDETRVEGEIICRSVTLPVTSGETENSRHYLVCCRHPLGCLRGCVAVCLFTSLVIARRLTRGKWMQTTGVI